MLLLLLRVTVHLFACTMRLLEAASAPAKRQQNQGRLAGTGTGGRRRRRPTNHFTLKGQCRGRHVTAGEGRAIYGAIQPQKSTRYISISVRRRRRQILLPLRDAASRRPATQAAEIQRARERHAKTKTNAKAKATKKTKNENEIENENENEHENENAEAKTKNGSEKSGGSGLARGRVRQKPVEVVF